MKNNGTTLVTLILLAFPGVSLAGDADTGKVTAQPCLECHYADDFVGESEDDIQSLIQGTVAEDSEHEGDNASLSEDEIADIAAFFARGE